MFTNVKQYYCAPDCWHFYALLLVTLFFAQQYSHVSFAYSGLMIKCWTIVGFITWCSMALCTCTSCWPIKCL